MDHIKIALERAKRQKREARSGKKAAPKLGNAAVDNERHSAEGPAGVDELPTDSSHDVPPSFTTDLSEVPQTLSEEQLTAFAEAASAAGLSTTHRRVDSPGDSESLEQGSVELTGHPEDPDLWIAPKKEDSSLDTRSTLSKDDRADDTVSEDKDTTAPKESVQVAADESGKILDSSIRLPDGSGDTGSGAPTVDQSTELLDAKLDADAAVATRVRRLDIDVAYLQRRRVMTRISDTVSIHFEPLIGDLLKRLDAIPSRKLAVTSPTSGCGKTLTAINLAVGLALQTKRRVILVDLDLNRPQIHHYFSYEKLPGISDYLSGQVAIPEALFAPSALGDLWVLPGHVSVAQPTEMLLAGILAELIGGLEALDPSSLLILNMPPLLETPDLGLWYPYMQQLLLVLEHNETTRDELTLAASRIEDLSLMGVVMNKIRI